LGPDAARAAFAAFAGDLGKVAFLGLVVVGIAWLTRRGRLPVAIASVAVLVLLLVEVWPVSRSVMAPTIADHVARDPNTGRDDVVEFLEKAGPPGTFRVFFPESELFRDNRLAGFGIATVGGYHAAKPKLYQDLIDTDAIRQLPWQALLNVRYVVFSRPISPTEIGPTWFQTLRQVHSGPGGTVYEYQLAMPRAMVIGAWEIAPDTGRQVIDSVSVVARNPATFTWLAQDPGIPSGAADSVGTAAITKYGLHAVDVEVQAARPAVLRLADLWYPDWKVRVDGKPATLLRADHALRAVVVPAGRHQVTFRYESGAFALGLWVSIGCTLIALLLLGASWWLGRRPAREREPAAALGAPA
jgi:hypothetical protein